MERVCFVSLSVVLAVWRVGGRSDWRPSASQRQWADVCPLCRRTRVLECSFGEGICQVRAVSRWMCVVFSHTCWSTWSICSLFQHVRCRTVKRVHVCCICGPLASVFCSQSQWLLRSSVWWLHHRRFRRLHRRHCWELRPAPASLQPVPDREEGPGGWSSTGLLYRREAFKVDKRISDKLVPLAHL